MATSPEVELEVLQQSQMADGNDSTKQDNIVHKGHEDIEIAVESAALSEAPITTLEPNDEATDERSDAPYCILPEREKIFLMLTASFAGMISPFSTSTYYPAVNALSGDLGVSISLINLTISTYLIFQGLAPSFTAALSETHGRRPAFLFCFVVYFGANIGLALQNSYAALMVLRCLQSTGSSGTVALASAVVADISTRAERGKYIAFGMMGTMLGPALGPVVGGLLSQSYGWRSIFWFLLALSGTFGLLVAIAFRETCRSIVGNGSVRPSRWNRSLWQVFREDFCKATLPPSNPQTLEKRRRRINPLNSIKVLGDRENCLIIVYTSLLWAGYVSIVSILSSQLGRRYHLKEVDIGLCYLPLGIGSITSRWSVAYLVDWKFRREAKRQGVTIEKNKQQDISAFDTEKARLAIAMPMVIGSCCCVIAYGWTMEYHTPLTAVLVVLFFVGNIATGSFVAVGALVVDINPSRVASASAAANLVRCLLGAGAVAWTAEMVNKPHAPRGANKKPIAAAANGEDTSFIVFGNDSKPSKKGKQSDAGSAGPATASKGKAPENGAAPEAEKKPDTRTLIAGASWTGKLPMTLFNEYAQKQRWEKPEYTIHRTAGGFTGGIILRQKNPKTQEVISLQPIVPPNEYLKERGIQESAVEARHFAAAYALFRVGNMKHIHMTLPPNYRDLWKGDFQDLKSQAIAQGHGYLYEQDPFVAKKHHDEAVAAKEKARANKAKQQEEEKKEQVISLDGQVQSRHILKGWQRVPKVEMGLKTRREVERLIRSDGVWNPNGIKLSKNDAQRISDDLSNIGFRRSHVEEATDVSKDREECLEWLLIHVPEDDLPKWTLPENYLAGVSLASGDMRREGKLKRLAAGGYALEVCSETLDDLGGDEAKAAEVLQRRLLGDHEAFSGQIQNSSNESDVWSEEQATLEAIFGDRYTNHDRICVIGLELQTPSKRPITLRARPPRRPYPSSVPILSVETELPAYIRLSILKQCLLHAKENFLGEQMLFNIIDWLEREIPGIIEKPGRLSEIASAASTSAEASSQRPSTAKKPRRQPKATTWAPNSPISQRLLAEWNIRQATPEQQRMLEARRNLPAWKLNDAIVQSVNSNQVTIISGETGSGKSTQSVQFVLDDLIKRSFGEHANIICTQPRRISALGLADRVADERCVKVGDEVGYAIRGESKQRAGFTKITFVTTGVLLRRLQTSGGSAEDVVKSLADVSHVVIDEVHERSLDTDFLLVLIRDVLKKQKDLKLVLMSATLDAAVFESYFKGSSSVGKVEIAGRTYPVQDIYLDEIVQATGFGDAPDDDSADEALIHDPRTGPKPAEKSVGSTLRAVGTRINYDLIARTVQWIDHELGHADGGILIFLPGVAEIDQTLRALRNVPNLHPLPLHASLQSSEQRLVFKKPPSGMRKVIAATNVAETSITIEDIVAVIDTGRVKETSFDPANNMVKLAEVWASKAACKQRRGRAGRVRAGKCYKLYTRSAEAKMADRPEPEIRRVPLEQLCLSVKAMGVSDVPTFLASALSPPETLAVEGAISLLRRIGALDNNEMTALGRHLSMIPADLRCGKLLVYGAAFSCLEACLTIAAVLTVKSPFVNPQTKRDESKAARAAFGNSHGDLLCDLHAYEQWAEKRSSGEPTSLIRRWCDENFLNHQTLMDISTNRSQYVSSLQEIGFLEPGWRPSASLPQAYNRFNDNDALVRAVVAGAFQPQLARIDFPDKKFAASSSGAVALDPESKTIKYFNEENGRVFVHPSSTMFDAQGFPGNSVFMSYFTKMATSKVFIRDLTPFNVYSLLMFSGPITIDPQGRGLLVDGWVRLRGWARIGVLVSRLRMMMDELLARKVDEPGMDMSESAVVKVVRRLAELDGLDR